MAAATMQQSLAEERAAMRELRHMGRMRAKAQRSREATAERKRRDRRRELRGNLRVAEAASAKAQRSYERTLARYAACSDSREAELGAELDRAYGHAIRATAEVRKIRALLGEVV